MSPWMFWNHNFFVTNKSPKKSNANTGLPKNGEPAFLSIGILRKPHGIEGEMKMEIWTDFPERLKKGVIVYVGEHKKEFFIESFKGKKGGYLVRLVGIVDPENCMPVVNKIVFVSSGDRPVLGKNQYYHHQIIGLGVFTKNNDYLGKIKEIIRTGSNDVYVVHKTGNDKGEILIPAVPQVIMNINLSENKMIVDPPQWA